jgi:hypothetical protein
MLFRRVPFRDNRNPEGAWSALTKSSLQKTSVAPAKQNLSSAGRSLHFSRGAWEKAQGQRGITTGSKDGFSNAIQCPVNHQAVHPLRMSWKVWQTLRKIVRVERSVLWLRFISALAHSQAGRTEVFYGSVPISCIA